MGPVPIRMSKWGQFSFRKGNGLTWFRDNAFGGWLLSHKSSVYMAVVYYIILLLQPKQPARIHAQAIGSSAQGLANALLFCIFTSMVRKRLVKALKQFCCCRKDSERMHLLKPSSDLSRIENTTQYDEGDYTVPRPELAEDAVHVEWTRKTSTGNGINFPSSLENSKYHSVSVSKRVTVGVE